MAYIAVRRFRQNTEHITVQGTVVFVQWRLAPSTRMETPLCPKKETHD
jgi:hypothetical protein